MDTNNTYSINLDTTRSYYTTYSTSKTPFHIITAGKDSSGASLFNVITKIDGIRYYWTCLLHFFGLTADKTIASLDSPAYMVSLSQPSDDSIGLLPSEVSTALDTLRGRCSQYINDNQNTIKNWRGCGLETLSCAMSAWKHSPTNESYLYLCSNLPVQNSTSTSN